MRILITGGAGYIGSHTCVELIEAGHEVVVVDSLVNGSRGALQGVERITGRAPEFHRIDIRERQKLTRLFASAQIDAVLHFAALKAVDESIREPLRYFDNNVGGTLVLAEAMIEAGVKTLVFSSSATVYGVPATVPVDEDAPLAAINPYGRSKIISEDMLRDLHRAHPELRIALLRYFNPGGAHPSGEIGEAPQKIPDNLLPYIGQVAVGRLDSLRIFGDDYPTPDGTGVRDYIHVVDVARGHLAALDTMFGASGPIAGGGVLTLNLGTGRGFSVLEILQAYERACGRRLPYEIVGRRPGDVAACLADPARAAAVMSWHAEHGIDRICADAWRWQDTHPAGYAEAAPA